MKIIKKLLPIFIIASLVLSIFSIQSYAAGSSIAFSNSKPSIGQTITVTARFSSSSSDPMFAIEAFVTYDPKVLEFVSTDNGVLSTPGQVSIVASPAGTVNFTANVKFKAIKAGTCAVSAERIKYIGDGDLEKPLSSSSANITVIDKSAQASSNANLHGLAVSDGTLVPKFSANVTSYNVTIPNEVEELWLNVSLADSKATYVVEGSRVMKVGNNRRTVIVTAENGNTKSYTVNIVRLDKNGNAPVEDPGDDPFTEAKEVNVGNSTMYLDENFSSDTVPPGFKVTDYAFNGENVPAVTDGTYVLLRLFTPDGSVEGFYAVLSKENFVPVKLLDVGGLPFCVLPTDKLPVGYEKGDYEIVGNTVTAYKKTGEEQSEFLLVYAKGPGGQNGFYRFDTVDQTLQRATDIAFEETKEPSAPKNEEEVQSNILNRFNDMSLEGKIIACVILAMILLLLIAIIVLVVKIVSLGEKKPKEPKELPVDDDDSVGFEYVSLADNVASPIIPADDIRFEPPVTAEPADEETTVDNTDDEEMLSQTEENSQTEELSKTEELPPLPKDENLE